MTRKNAVRKFKRYFWNKFRFSPHILALKWWKNDAVGKSSYVVSFSLHFAVEQVWNDSNC